MPFMDRKINPLQNAASLDINNKSSYNSRLSQGTFEAGKFNSEKVKNELIALCPTPPTNMQSFTHSISQLQPSDNLLASMKTQNATKRRARSDACPKSRKKERRKYEDEQKNLDNDLLGLVGAMNTDKNLDSESSADTIIIDGDDTSESPPKDGIQNNVQFCDLLNADARTTQSRPLFKNSPKLSLPHKKEENRLLNMKGLGNVPVNNNKMQHPTPTPTLQSLLTQNELNKNVQKVGSVPVNNKMQHPTPTLRSLWVQSEMNKNVQNSGNSSVNNNMQFSPAPPSLSSTNPLNQLLLSVNAVGNSNSASVLRNSSAQLPTSFYTLRMVPSNLQPLPNSAVTGNSNRIPPNKGSPVNKARRRGKNSPKGNVSLSVLKNFKLDQSANYESVYASMGLDEDLCDIGLKKQPTTLNITSKTPCNSSSSPTKINNMPHPPIKIEPEDSFNECTDNEKNTPFIDSKHGTTVSMTFEVEPPSENNDFFDDEEDLPLSVVKNLTSMSSGLEHKFNEEKNASSNSTTNIPPSLFIKKELIEDEIASESGAVSTKNLPPVSNTADNPLPKSDVASEHNLIGGVKIKTEPIDTDYYSEYVAKNPIPSVTNSNKDISCDALAAMKSSTNENSLLKHPINEDNLDFQSPDKNSQKSSQELTKSAVSVNASKAKKASPKRPAAKTNKKKSPAKKTQPLNAEKSISENLVNNSDPSDLSGKINENLETSSDYNTKSVSVPDNEAEYSIGSPMVDLKRKKKGIDNIDENLPITLLIKKAKPDVLEKDAPDSFLCTDTSNKLLNNSKSSSACDISENVLNESDKNSDPTEPQNDLNNFEISTANSNNNKKKKQNKKNQSKKKVIKKAKTSSEVLQSELGSMDFETQNSQSDEGGYESAVSAKQNLSVNNDNISQPSDPSELNSSVKNVKRKGSPTYSEEYSDISSYDNQHLTALSQDSQLDETMSTISSQTSNSNIEDMNYKSMSAIDPLLKSSTKATPPKKKKRAKSYGWYKKKKPRTKTNNLPIEEAFPVPESTSELTTTTEPIADVTTTSAEPATKKSIHDHIMTSGKLPIVVIRNFLSENITVNVKGQDTNNSLFPEQETVKASPKSKKKKGKASRKKKKSSKQSKNILLNNDEILHENTTPECDRGSENTSIESTHKESAISEENNSALQSTKETVESDLHKSSNGKNTISSVEEISINEQANAEKKAENTPDQFSIVANKKKKISPSLNIKEFAQDIATFEAILLKQCETNSSETIKKFNEENIRECSILESENAEIAKELGDPALILSKDLDQNRTSSNSSICKSSTKSCVGIVETSYIQSTDSLQIKKEMIDSPGIYEKSFNQSSLPLSEKSSVEDKSKAPDTLDLASIKKEKSAGDSVYKSKTSVLNAVNCQADAIPSIDSASRTNSPSLCNVLQNTQPKDVNTVGLSIKKEVCDVAKIGSFIDCSIKDQNDLIQKVSKPHASIGNALLNSRRKSHLSVDAQPDSIASVSQTNSVTNMNDDEIQVLPVEKTTSNQNIPCVDLTDDNYPNSKLETLEKTSQLDSAEKISSHLIKQNESVKAQNANSDSSSVIMPDTFATLKEKSTTITHQKPDELPDQLESFKANVLTSGLVNDGTDSESNLIKKPNIPFIIRDKYIDEYFAHPFPPSIVLHNKTQRNRDYVYSRINSKSWNLSLSEIESRLRQAENNVASGRKLGDIVKLRKYTVSFNEVECYHRILGVAPSHKLLSKCYGSPVKKYGTKIRTELDNSFNPFQQGISPKAAKDISDIIQGITEAKMMCSGDSTKTNTTFYERDCPSADTRDSLDSYVSNLSDKSYIPTQNKDINTSKISLPVKENELLKEASSSGRNSVLSSAASEIQDSFKSDVCNVDFSRLKSPDFVKSLSLNESYLENSFNSFVMPGKQIAEQTVDSNVSNQSSFVETSTAPFTNQPPFVETSNNSFGNQSPFVETSNTSFANQPPFVETSNNSFANQSPFVETSDAGSFIDTSNASFTNQSSFIESSNASFAESRTDADINKFSTPQTAPVESVMMPDTNEKMKPPLDIDNKLLGLLPTAELVKILETAGSIRTSTDTAIPDDSNAWTSKTTFEYNHTQSVPISGINSTYNASEKIESFSSVPSATPELDGNSTEQIGGENSDDDYVENEPIHDEPDTEDDTSQADAEEEEREKSPEIPQYKSKWEKIMERKSQEQKEKEKINEHLLKDCFPVSSTIKTRSKKISKSVNELKTKESTTVKNKSEEIVADKRSKQNKSKNKSEAKEAKQDKSKDKLDSDGEKQNKDALDADDEKQNKDTLVADGEKSNKDAGDEKQNSKSIKNSNKKNKIDQKDEKKKSGKKAAGAKDDVSDLFKPDKLVKSSPTKTDTANKSNEKSKRFYGNRVTNRGSFLTETKTPELMKRIPKKKTPEITKKPNNVRSEEFHSLVKSPEIRIGLTSGSKYKNSSKSLDSRKNSEFYKSPLSYNSPSTSSHFIRTKRMRDKQFGYMKPRFSGRGRGNMQNKRTFSGRQSYSEYDEDMQGRKVPLLDMPSSNPSHQPYWVYDEDVPGQQLPLPDPAISSHQSYEYGTDWCDGKSLLEIPSSITSHSGNESMLGNKTPFLETPQSVSPFNPNVESMMGRPIPVLNSSFEKPILGRPIPVLNSSVEKPMLGRPIPVLNSSSTSSPVLPPKSFQSNANTSTDFLQSIMSSVFKKSISSSVSEVKGNMLPVPGLLNNATWDNNKFISPCGVTQKTNAPANLPVSVPLGNISSAESLDPRKAARMNLVPNLPVNTPSFDSSLNSPPFTQSTNSSVPPASRKATCLVPQHLKSLVGHATIETHNVRLLMLEWSVDWLMQQQQFKDPPPISNALKKVVSTYDSFEDYYNTYFPLMLLDTWHRIYVSWTHLNQTSPYSCQISSYSVKSHYVSVECQTVFNTDAHPKGVFPDEGSILMVKYSTKTNDYTIKILGYVTQVKTRRFNSVTDSKIFSSLRSPKDSKPEALQILTLTYVGAYNSEEIDKRQPIRIHVLCNVKPTLKQNDALLYISKSPLQRSILNPVADGLRSLTLTPRNSPLEKINECVRDITKGILSPHPLPLLTVVRAGPESDRLNIIPLLIEKMKTTYKTKVLLCVRTVRALGDIAANICLNQSLKLVIVNKRCDTNPQFQKYLLDEIVSAEVKKMEEAKPTERIHLKNELFIKTKKQVLSECDVVLSLVRNSHDEFMGDTFAEKECIAQMCCIVDEANLCTEPETLIPILHGISKLILIGDPDYSAKVLSKTASSYDYSQSFFQRAYDLDLLEE